MGRCYEFGAVIGEGCGHTMVVPTDAGRCECPECGVVCTGRFSGCAAVIAKPGYVHALAPPSARQPVEGGGEADGSLAVHPRIPVEVAGPTASNGHAVDHSLETTSISMAPDVRRFLIELKTLLDTRDGELVDAFTRLEEAYTALAKKVEEVHDGQRHIDELLESMRPAIEKVADSADKTTLGSLRGFLGRP